MRLLSTIACLFTASTALAQGPVPQQPDFAPIGVAAESTEIAGTRAIRVIKDLSVKEFDEPTFARVKGIKFTDGTIRLRVRSRFTKDAPDFARGFIGVAFRINDDNSKFECIYVRPSNARVDDQIRRNHTIQYFAYPEFKFQRLRKESPEKYESYADMAMDEWIELKIVVKGATAKLFVNDAAQPALVVTDLKLGPDSAGGIGLFVDVGTEGYFADLRISN